MNMWKTTLGSRRVGGWWWATLMACSVAQAQPVTVAPAQMDCPAPMQAVTADLLGTWQARWEGVLPSGAEGAALAPPQLELQPHPEWEGNVKGRAHYAAQAAWVVGDVNEGEVTLEESLDGQRISATWLGDVVDGSCAQLIRGTYFTDAHPDGIAFTLQKIGR